MDKKTAIKELLDDNNYYGDFGRKYLSNSDIINLLKNPTQFRVPTEKSKPLIEGGYFHTCMLEPEKKDNFKIIDCASRSTKLYKEALESNEYDVKFCDAHGLIYNNMGNCCGASSVIKFTKY